MKQFFLISISLIVTSGLTYLFFINKREQQNNNVAFNLKCKLKSHSNSGKRKVSSYTKTNR